MLNESGLGLDVSVRHHGSPVFFFASAYYSDVLFGPETRIAQCTIGPVNLASGTYSIDVKLCRPFLAWLEQIDHTCEFEIERQVSEGAPLDFKAQRMLGFVIPNQLWKSLK